ncbi:BMC domain-containing protein, partial [Salmonella enterica subsp. enterica serovar Montevideo]|nr:BMC domain-containing protein [Salmonella enterica subsp. enterica serovar Montevideo]
MSSTRASLLPNCGYSPSISKSIARPSSSRIGLTFAACDIATKSGAVEIGFLDRFTGAVVLTGDVSAVEYALKQVT